MVTSRRVPTRRRALLLGLIGVLLAAATAFTISMVQRNDRASTARVATVASCGPTSMRIVEHGQLAGAGHQNILFWIKNVSSNDCSVQGWPSVELASPSGAPLGIQTLLMSGRGVNFVGGMDSGNQPPKVLMAHGGSVASFWVDGLDIPTGSVGSSSRNCVDTNKMYVSFSHGGAVIPFSATPSYAYYWCGQVIVMPILAGDSGSLPHRALSQFGIAD